MSMQINITVALLHCATYRRQRFLVVLIGQHNKLAINYIYIYIPEREQLSDASTTSQLKRIRRVATPTVMQYCT